MARIDVLDILRTKKQTPLEFDFDNLWIPPMNVYLTPQDVESLRRIATSLRLSSKIELKYKMIDDIMRNRGFKRFSAGTNRVVYSFLEDDRFVVKIAVDKVGMQDNPLEYQNQALLKPYCTKMFYISPCGTVGFAERVLPIKNRREFKEIASDVFDILINKILGKYVMEDIGTKYFMNYGIRRNDGPVLLDYPFIYKLDGKKLFCNKTHPVSNEPCNGEIDYDAGFNHLVCTRCGKIYLASDLRDDSIDNKIIIKGGIQMKIVLKKGDKIISSPIPMDEVMVRPKSKPDYKSNGLIVKISGGSPVVVKTKDEDANPPVITADNDQKDNTQNILPNAEEEKTSDDIKTETDSESKNVENENSEAETDNETDVEFYTKSNFITGEDNTKESESNENTNVDKDAIGEDSNSDNEEKSNDIDNDNKDEIKDTNKDEVKKVETKKATTKTSEVKKGTTSKSSNKKSNNEQATNSVETNAEEEDKYAQYDTDDTPAYQPIRKKKSTAERDANGRFVSSGNGKKKTTRIPSK